MMKTYGESSRNEVEIKEHWTGVREYDDDLQRPTQRSLVNDEDLG